MAKNKSSKSKSKSKNSASALDLRFVSGLSEETRVAVCDLLNQRLADVIDLTLAVKQAHWNLKGEGFIGVHELLDDVADHLRESLDMIAERVTIIGGQAKGTSQAVTENTQMKPYPTDQVKITQHLQLLTDRFNEVGGRIREAIETAGDHGDADTEDLFTEVSRQIDKDAWFIGANLDPE